VEKAEKTDSQRRGRYMVETSPPPRRYVVDTNILAYCALHTIPFYDEISALLAEPLELLAPDSWRSELLSVVWQSIWSQGIALDDGLELLEQVERLLNWSVPVGLLWREALVCAVEHNCSTYDTVFVVLAEREQSKLLTYDQRLLASFPEVAMRPGKVLSP
jgi:predicted nucleic acid-binding protein